MGGTLQKYEFKKIFYHGFNLSVQYSFFKGREYFFPPLNFCVFQHCLFLAVGLRLNVTSETFI